jgi:uncharacterized protein
VTRNGAPVWAEIRTTDPATSIKFYSELLGWHASDPVDEFGGYVNFTLDGKNVAGLTPDSEDRWVLYLHVADAAVPAAASGATKVEGPHPVADLGVMVMLTDPTGAEIGARQRGTHTGFEAFGVAGAPVWHELHTADFDTAIDFYARAFGWKATAMPAAPGFRMSTLGTGQQAVAGIYDAKETLAGQSPHWQHYFGVNNPVAAAAIIEQNGGRVLEQPRETPFGIMATAVDPNGVPFTIIGV